MVSFSRVASITAEPDIRRPLLGCFQMHPSSEVVRLSDNVGAAIGRPHNLEVLQTDVVTVGTRLAVSAYNRSEATHNFAFYILHFAFKKRRQASWLLTTLPTALPSLGPSTFFPLHPLTKKNHRFIIIMLNLYAKGRMSE